MQDIATGARVRNVYTGQLATVTDAGMFLGKLVLDVTYDGAERGSSGILSAFELVEIGCVLCRRIGHALTDACLI